MLKKIVLVFLSQLAFSCHFSTQWYLKHLVSPSPLCYRLVHSGLFGARGTGWVSVLCQLVVSFFSRMTDMSAEWRLMLPFSYVVIYLSAVLVFFFVADSLFLFSSFVFLSLLFIFSCFLDVLLCFPAFFHSFCSFMPLVIIFVFLTFFFFYFLFLPSSYYF